MFLDIPTPFMRHTEDDDGEYEDEHVHGEDDKNNNITSKQIYVKV